MAPRPDPPVAPPAAGPCSHPPVPCSCPVQPRPRPPSAPETKEREKNNSAPGRTPMRPAARCSLPAGRRRCGGQERRAGSEAGPSLSPSEQRRARAPHAAGGWQQGVRPQVRPPALTTRARQPPQPPHSAPAQHSLHHKHTVLLLPPLLLAQRVQRLADPARKRPWVVQLHLLSGSIDGCRRRWGAAQDSAGQAGCAVPIPRARPAAAEPAPPAGGAHMRAPGHDGMRAWCGAGRGRPPAGWRGNGTAA